MEKYPMLGLIVRYGAPGSIGVAVAAAVLALWLTWMTLAWGGIVVAAGVGAFLYVFCKAFVELIRLIVDMLLPQ